MLGDDRDLLAVVSDGPVQAHTLKRSGDVIVS